MNGFRECSESGGYIMLIGGDEPIEAGLQSEVEEKPDFQGCCTQVVEDLSPRTGV